MWAPVLPCGSGLRQLHWLHFSERRAPISLCVSDLLRHPWLCIPERQALVPPCGLGLWRLPWLRFLKRQAPVPPHSSDLWWLRIFESRAPLLPRGSGVWRPSWLPPLPERWAPVLPHGSRTTHATSLQTTLIASTLNPIAYVCSSNVWYCAAEQVNCKSSGSWELQASTIGMTLLYQDMHDEYRGMLQVLSPRYSAHSTQTGRRTCGRPTRHMEYE
jgi:hypothetical protein